MDESYNNSDVLCGCGELVFEHAGNVQYRKIIDSKRNEYNDASNSYIQREDIASVVVHTIRNRMKGRFLRKDSRGIWFDIGDVEAVQKTHAVLRYINIDNQPSTNNNTSIRGRQSLSLEKYQQEQQQLQQQLQQLQQVQQEQQQLQQLLQQLQQVRTINNNNNNNKELQQQQQRKAKELTAMHPLSQIVQPKDLAAMGQQKKLAQLQLQLQEQYSQLPSSLCCHKSQQQHQSHSQSQRQKDHLQEQRQRQKNHLQEQLHRQNNQLQDQQQQQQQQQQLQLQLQGGINNYIATMTAINANANANTLSPMIPGDNNAQSPPLDMMLRAYQMNANTNMKSYVPPNNQKQLLFQQQQQQQPPLTLLATATMPPPTTTTTTTTDTTYIEENQQVVRLLLQQQERAQVENMLRRIEHEKNQRLALAHYA